MPIQLELDILKHLDLTKNKNILGYINIHENQ